jgi:hypothetical protein
MDFMTAVTTGVREPSDRYIRLSAPVTEYASRQMITYILRAEFGRIVSAVRLRVPGCCNPLPFDC